MAHEYRLLPEMNIASGRAGGSTRPLTRRQAEKLRRRVPVRKLNHLSAFHRVAHELMTSNHHETVMNGSTPGAKLCAPKQRSHVMNFYIKEWPDDTATLMTQEGRVVWNFASVEEAAAAAQNDAEPSLDFTGAAARRSLRCARADR